MQVNHLLLVTYFLFYNCHHSENNTMKFLAAFLAISFASANPTLRDVTCPDVGLLCLDSNTYTYCINLGIMRIVGSTVYGCPAGFVCDHSTTTPCIPEQNVADEVVDVHKKEKTARLNANLDDLELRWPQTTTEEPDYPSTTFDPPIVTVKQSIEEANMQNKDRAAQLNANLDDLELKWPQTTTEEPDYPSTTFDPPIVTVKQSLGNGKQAAVNVHNPQI